MKDYILEIDSDDDDIIEARLFLTASTGNVSANGVISAYFDSARDRDEARAMLSEFVTRAVDRERVDWLELYQQSLQPMFVGNRFIVAPDALYGPTTVTRAVAGLMVIRVLLTVVDAALEPYKTPFVGLNARPVTE